jgi:glycosyltransferase involved in cell wall biosynthesis
MRIAHVIYWLSALGGGPTSVVASLARAQTAAGHKVTVLPASRSIGPQVLAPGEYDGLSVLQSPVEHHLRWYNRTVLNEMRRQIRGHDIVHIHANWRYHMLAAAQVASEYRIPFVVSPHGNLDAYSYRQKRYFKLPYFTIFERKWLNQAAAIHCCSEMELKEVSAWPIKARKIVVPNPVEDRLLKQPPDFGALNSQIPQLRDSHKVISFLARFNLVKRPEILVAAFQKLAAEFPDWVLILAGPHEDPQLTSRLVKDVQTTGLSERVLMPGMIANAAKAALLRRSAIYVQSSIHENFCVSVAEAMCFGVPCVVTGEVALADEIKSAQAGFVCEGTPDSFARALRRLITDENLRKQCGANGASVAPKFAPEEVERQFTVEYQQCIDARRLPVN